MVGITSYGAYIPVYRLSREILNQVWGGGGKGEKAVANFDEDSLTMGVEGARDCLKGTEKESIDALYFASTTPPFKEKQSASIIAAALDLREDIIAADITDSLRCGTIALRMALDAVKAGSARKVLVVVSDCRIPPPNSAFEPLFGDGAAAFLVGGNGAAVEIEGSHYITSEFIDIWRLEYDKITRTWEDRFIRDEGYTPYLQKAVATLLKAHNLTAKDFATAAFNALDERTHRDMARRLGLDAKTQVQDPLFGKVGHTGAASTPMILIAALEEAKPGDRILLASYGDGADAHILRVTDDIEKIRDKRGIKKNLDSKLMLDNYGKYVKFRNLMEFEPSLEIAPRTSLPEIWRDRNWVYKFHGHRCKKCGKIQFPMQKACMYCQADEKDLEEIGLSDKKGTLSTFSMDERSPVIDPPNVLAAVTLEGGGRFFSQMTDRDVNNLKVGIPMELTFRRIHDALGVHNYFWKCRPARE